MQGTEDTTSCSGGAGADTLYGYGGDDDLYGDAGNDVFMFATGSGNDTIWDFDAVATDGQDRIDLRGYSSITAATFASDVTWEQVGADTLVHIQGVADITLKYVTVTDVGQSDFRLSHEQGGRPRARSVVAPFLQISFAPKLRSGSISGRSLLEGIAAVPPFRARNRPLPAAAFSMPSATITSPRRSTVSGQPLTRRPA